ncbi:MAG: hypothetical protein JXX14_07420 [Deltaproteobacteria bacterium]|nr:hypothetical protein [Deltaproteobacteria bacterium]
MKTIFFALSLMLVCSLVSAQVVIENPTVGSTVLTEVVKEVGGEPQSAISTTTVQPDTLGAGLIENTSTAGTQTFFYISKDIVGALEFSLEGVNIPSSFTASNFTARLVGLSGQPTTASVSLGIDLFDMADDQEDNLIEDFDRDLADGAVPINGESVVNGAFEDGMVDVTAQLRADLFGDSTEGVSTGFIVQATPGTGLIEFPGIADAYIELNLIGSDSDVDSDTSVVIVDTDTDSDGITDTAVVDTSDIDSATENDTSVVDTATGATGTDSGDTVDTVSGSDGTGDSDYWDIVNEDSDDEMDHDNDGGNVKCTCTTAGADTIRSIWNLIF